MEAIIRIKEPDVDARLKELGLTREILVDSAKQGHLAFIGCTINHPPLLPGILAWGETVRSLREYLAPDDWSRSDENNYSLVISPGGKIALAVATGDEETGLENGHPSNKARKGRATRRAVNQNQMSFDFGPAAALPDINPSDEEKRATWILLLHRDDNEVRLELSLPASITEGHIDSWKERIILGSFPFDGDIDVIDITPEPPQPDISIDIKRRA
jgi:hypothetical protein